MRTVLLGWTFLFLVSPLFAGEREISVGLGLASSAIDVDVPRDGDDQVNPRGLGLRAKVTKGEAWGGQVRYLNLDDDYGTGGGIDHDRIDLLALYEFYRSPESRHRLQVSFGAALVDFEERVPLLGSVSDDAWGPSFGVGWEWGRGRAAFFMDFAVTFVDVTLAAGRESWEAGSLLSGATVRF